ncbi:aldo/keto reductase [Streptomyces canus]|uniref:aldo/keto reductase n=1 Tax=Streptomyces canus TaxID=58343 RepID=UPI002256A926|nr:aldo/keto reductase [Streptomyces canus]MCX4856144.1 aldo/keto reductase [Streptomyces canus]WSW38378.1 aldo/keto reductase [Streptomyces canus]
MTDHHKDPQAVSWGDLAEDRDEPVHPVRGSDVRPVFPRNSQDNLAANMPLVQLLQERAVRKGATPGQIDLAWLLAQKPWIVAIPSTTRLSHLLENIGAEEVRFSPDELQEFNTALANITIHGDRLPSAALAMTGVEAPPR